MAAVPDRRDYEYLLQRIDALKSLIARFATVGGITSLTGPITAGPGSGPQATTITPNAITNTELDDMPAGTFKGRAAGGGAGDPEDLDADDASDVLDGAADPFVRTSALAGGAIVGSWIPLAVGTEPLAFVSDGAGQPILVFYIP